MSIALPVRPVAVTVLIILFLVFGGVRSLGSICGVATQAVNSRLQDAAAQNPT